MVSGIINFKKFLLMNMVIISAFYRVFAQTNADTISDILVNSGFENIRVATEDNKYYISFENNKYRWDVRALSTLLDSVVTHAPENTELNIIQLKFNIPQFVTKLTAKSWLDYRRDSIDSEMDSLIHLSYRTEEAWKHLKKTSSDNTGQFKFDIVFYPQFYLSNIGFNKIYEIQKKRFEAPDELDGEILITIPTDRPVEDLLDQIEVNCEV